MYVSIDALNIKETGNKALIKWIINRGDFKEKIDYDTLPTILPIDIFNGRKYRVLNIYDVNMNPYDGFACEGFIEIEFI